MSEGKWTSGEWRTGENCSLTGPRTPSCSGATCRDAVAKEQDPDAPDYYEIVFAGFETVAIVPGEPEERVANARLIAASKTLYAALRDVLSWASAEMPPTIREQARAALAKARGET